MESSVTIACCQVEPMVGRKDENIEKTLKFAGNAADQGASLIVLPELANTGYVFETRSEAFSLAEKVPEGESTRLWEEFATEHKVFLAVGIAERIGDSLYNSSVLIGPMGYIGKYQKLHLWDREKLFFEPGDEGLPIYQTELGRFAMLICYDLWFPEVTRIYAQRGADLIINMTNWVPESKEMNARIARSLCVSQAHMNGVFMAATDRVGVERGQLFLGNSMIVAPSGEILSGPASSDKEEIITASCNLMDSRTHKRKTALSHKLSDRRTDIYDILLGYNDEPKFY